MGKFSPKGFFKSSTALVQHANTDDELVGNRATLIQLWRE
jgi:hypothetical protein